MQRFYTGMQSPSFKSLWKYSNQHEKIKRNIFYPDFKKVLKTKQMNVTVSWNSKLMYAALIFVFLSIKHYQTYKIRQKHIWSILIIKMVIEFNWWLLHFQRYDIYLINQFECLTTQKALNIFSLFIKSKNISCWIQNLEF